MNILIISSDKNYGDFLSKRITDSFPGLCSKSESMPDALALLDKKSYRLIILCLPVLRINCPFEALEKLKQKSGTARIISIHDNINIPDAMRLVREGMYDCFNRPFSIEQLTKSIQRLLEESSDEVKTPLDLIVETKNVIHEKQFVKGLSRVTRDMFAQIDLVGPTSFSVIVYGETGTGKESVAHQIATSKKIDAPYVTIDCGCLSKELALSELFGHEKGSFTGAVSQKKGAFESAHHGTLFLDEVGNLDYEVQGYLLRAIQERRIKRVGGHVDIPVSVRIIVASNEDLAEAVKRGRFREDLFHRLNEFKINVPPLRERIEDLPLFVEQFINETNSELSKNVLMPDAFTLLVLKKYDWRGNVRELRNIVRRACLLTPDHTAISFLQLPDYINEFDSDKYIDSADKSIASKPTKKDTKATISIIQETLESVNYNKTVAARLLGVDRKTIYNKLRKI